MTRADKILIIVMMICSVLLFVPLLNHKEEASVALVSVKNEEIMRIDLSKDGQYEVEGTNGKVSIEVKDHQIRVTQETSKHHTCSKQGFVSDVNVPIVCLPNETVITIEGNDEDGEDTMIQ